MRIALTRSIMLAGADAEKGDVYEVSRLLAFELIGQGSAVRYFEEGEEPEPAPTLEELGRIQAGSAASDPKPLRVGPRNVTEGRNVSSKRSKKSPKEEDEMDRFEKASALLKSAEALGVEFEMNAGVLELKPTPIDEVTAMALVDLEPFFPEIRSIMEKRALSARGNELIGRRVRSSELGDATIASDNGDGSVSVLTHPPADSDASPMTVTAMLKSLLILPEVAAGAETTSAPSAIAAPERRGWLSDLMRRSRSSSAASNEPRDRTNWWR